MTREGTKEVAEAMLRELPSVIGAFVREDVHGHPREVHLLVRAGPNPRTWPMTSANCSRSGSACPWTSASSAWIGEALGLDTEPARLRTAAAATLIAVDSTCVGRSRFEVEHVAVETAFGREYVLVSVLASSPYLGRRPIPLAGAHPVEMDAESAAALAALKAVNRTLSLVLRLPESRGPRARPTSRRS
jgi:hypothetical protein